MTEQELLKKYPKIFRQKDLPMTDTCMCWGIDCGPGWYPLIDHLCSLLQWDIDHNNEPQVEATQVKEKFGSLRFYTNSDTDRQGGAISFAEHMSQYICEACGNPAKTIDDHGWFSTLCEPCREDKDGRK